MDIVNFLSLVEKIHLHFVFEQLVFVRWFWSLTIWCDVNY